MYAAAAVAAGFTGAEATGVEIAGNAAPVILYNEGNTGMDHTPTVPLTDAAEMSDVHSSTSAPLNYTRTEHGIVALEDYANIQVKRERVEGDGVDDNTRAEERNRKVRKTHGDRKDDEDEPEDPLLAHMETGGSFSSTLNEESMGSNYCVMTITGMINSYETTADGLPKTQDPTDKQNHGYFAMPLSMSKFRYKQPFRSFMSLHNLYRIRGMQVTGHPITLRTNYQVGSQQSNQVEQLAANAQAAAAQQFVHSTDLDVADLSTKVADGRVPRTGPVATLFVKRKEQDPYNLDLTWDSTYEEAVHKEGCVVHRSNNDSLPSFDVEYIPALGEDAAGFRAPHGLTRYNSIDNAVADEAWPSLGTFYAITSETMAGIPLYELTVKVLVEFASPVRIPYALGYDPGLAQAPGGSSDRRRLVSIDSIADRHSINKQPWQSQAKFQTSNNYGASGVAAGAQQGGGMNTQVSTNATNISTNVSRLNALETLANNLRTHAGTYSYNVHLTTPTHTLHGRILTNETDITTLTSTVADHTTALSAFVPAWTRINAFPVGVTQGGLVVVSNQNLYASGIVDHNAFNWQLGQIGVRQLSPTVREVVLRGLIRKSDSSNFSTAQLLLTLPVGYRPAAQRSFVTSCHVGGSPSHRIDVYMDGSVTLQTTGVGTFVTLGGISFYTN